MQHDDYVRTWRMCRHENWVQFPSFSFCTIDFPPGDYVVEWEIQVFGVADNGALIPTSYTTERHEITIKRKNTP